ncbi:MAG: hypothetical protein D6733_02815 [Methanobacteriota archaeon]|nr:MAG: hypothetical protein D6733_02815 [Euryarchaeota archaeon]
MVFCTHCGKKPREGDLYCRGCGTRLQAVSPEQAEVERAIRELKGLVERVAEEIKKELLHQVAEVEKGFRDGVFTKEEFDSEVEEIRGRLLSFTGG